MVKLHSIIEEADKELAKKPVYKYEIQDNMDVLIFQFECQFDEQEIQILKFIDEYSRKCTKLQYKT